MGCGASINPADYDDQLRPALPHVPSDDRFLRRGKSNMDNDDSTSNSFRTDTGTQPLNFGVVPTGPLGDEVAGAILKAAIRGYLARSRKYHIKPGKASAINELRITDDSLLIPTSPYVFVGMRNSKLVEMIKDDLRRGSDSNQLPTNLAKHMRARAMALREDIDQDT